MNTPPPAKRPPPQPQEDPASAATPQLGGVLLVDADPLLARLIEEWLADEGFAVHASPPLPAAATDGYRLVIVDLPFPRRTGVDSIRQVASHHPGVPIIALSPTIFASAECCGSVSRSLGVDCALAKPTTRETLIGAVRRLLPA